MSDQPRISSSVFHLPDGRLAWTVLETAESSQASTKIEVRSEHGVVSTLHVLEGIADQVVASPAGDGLYVRRYFSPPFRGSEDLLFVSLPDGTERRISRLSRLHYPRPRFAVSADGQSLYHGQTGRLWKVELPGGAVKPVAFHASVRLDVPDPVAPAKSDLALAGDVRQPRSILDPKLAPDGRSLVFGAAGHLWQQPLEGGQARRLSQGSAFESEPVFSPDGTQLAFVHREKGKEEVRVFSFTGQHTRTLASGSIYWDPSWSPDGRRVVFVEHGGALSGSSSRCPCRVVAVTVKDGKREVLIGSPWWWGTRPHFSSDGQWLYFVGPPSPGTLYRLRLGEEAEPEPLSQLTRRGISRALVSPGGTWMAFKRNLEIWLAPIGSAPIGDEDVRQVSPEGGDTFAFTLDGSALIYSAGNRVWRQPVNGGSRQEIPVRLILERPIPPPLLLRQVRVLNFDAGGFSRETSVFIERGRIEWIGSEQDLPPETVTVDADGRFAIPGLFDLHVHTLLGGASEDAYLGYGITSIRDVGGSLAWLNALADRSEASGDPVPRYFFSGAFTEQAGPWSDFYIRVMLEGDEEARSYVRRLKEAGVSFIKVHPPISWPLQRAVAEEARRLNLPVVGHGVFPEEIIRSVTLGYWSLEHLGRVHDDVHQLLAAAGTRATPTLTIAGGNTLLMRDEPERLADPKLRAFVPGWWIRQVRRPWTIDARSLRGGWVDRLASIRAAHAAGVSLQIGTDAEIGVPRRFQGAPLHWELENFVQAGLSPLEVLRIATQQAAEAVGAEDELGTLEPGKLADIVLLDANPLEDIKNTQTIWRVIKGGWVFDPEKLRPPQSADVEQ